MKRLLTFLVAVATAATALLIQTGCETQSADANGLRVEPHAVGLRINQSQEFTASGGFTYTWSLSDASLGVLSRTDGPTVTYISRFNGGSNTAAVVQRLTVTSQVGSDRSVQRAGESNDASIVESGFIDTAEAVIEHLPVVDAPPTAPGTNVTAISVFPSAVTLTRLDNTQQFTASGGSSYIWTISGDTSLGSLSALTGNPVVFTYSGTTNGTVTIRARSGDIFGEATITLRYN